VRFIPRQDSERIYKASREEPTSVMRIEMEKIVRELPGDPEIVMLFQNINDRSITVSLTGAGPERSA
jgi:hypothetical protein